MIAKSLAFAADVLLLNLEDGVAASRKEEARANAVRVLLSADFGYRETVVRVNELNSEIGRRDIAEVLPCHPDGICLPKVESPELISSADSLMGELEREHGLPAGGIKLHAMIESAAGVLRVREIAGASARMASLIFGSADYTADMHCKASEDRSELWLALHMIVAGARTASLDAIDAPCFDLRNSTLLQREAAQARSLGFDGKSALHPGQLHCINEVFGVTEEELVWAGKVMTEMEQAEDRGRACSTLEGQLIDNPHRNAAVRILDRARLAKIAAEEPRL
jgi:citrate lyase subunit beta/citryl-CoA lyase